VKGKQFFSFNKGFNMYAGENNKANGGFEHSGLYVG
jgi:hypothetical protein